MAVRALLSVNAVWRRSDLIVPFFVTQRDPYYPFRDPRDTHYALILSFSGFLTITHLVTPAHTL